MKLAATGDNHLSEKATAGGKLIVGSDGRSIRAADRERCLLAVADRANAQRVDAVLHAGDLFDTPRPTPSEYVIAERFVDRICCHGTPLVMVGCNHGLSQNPVEAHALAPLAGRHPNLHILLEPTAFILDTASGPLQVAGLPWPQRALLAAKEEMAGLSPEALNALISRKLALIVQSLLARRMPGMPFVLIAHTMLREAVFSPGETAPDPGMILLGAQDLAGFDAVVLGDIHRAQSFGPEGRIFYTGSTDRVSFNEESEAKGWWLMALEGERFAKELIETPARRYVTYDPIDLATGGNLLSAQAEASDLETCPIYRGKGMLSQEEYDTLAPVLAQWREIPTFVETLEITRQTSARSKEMQGNLSPEAALRLWHEVNGRPEDLGELVAEHRRLSGMA